MTGQENGNMGERGKNGARHKQPNFTRQEDISKLYNTASDKAD